MFSVSPHLMSELLLQEVLSNPKKLDTFIGTSERKEKGHGGVSFPLSFLVIKEERADVSNDLLHT